MMRRDVGSSHIDMLDTADPNNEVHLFVSAIEEIAFSSRDDKNMRANGWA